MERIRMIGLGKSFGVRQVFSNVSFEIKDSIALKYTYTITTDSTNLTTVLKELEKITPVLFEEKGGKIEVRMKK